MLVLGIETSCDETSAAIVENGRKILSNVVLSSLHLHKSYGGVVPEIACRHHAELIDVVIGEAFRKAKRNIGQIGLIAVTNGPGLIGALLVGISAAKGLGLSRNIPLMGVNHIWAHLYSPMMNPVRNTTEAVKSSKISNGVNVSRIRFPFIGLAVSGGHTNLVFAEDFDEYRHLGRTTDDAVGEAFDKVAKVLKLGYPGGPLIEKFARSGDAHSIKFPKSLLDAGSLDFSFSGIKTAVLYYVQRETNSVRSWESGVGSKKLQTPNSKLQTYDICASFQDSVIDVITGKSIKACQKKALRTLVVGGGVSLNSRLREMLSSECGKFKINVYFPQRELCMDNAAMVAGLGYQLYRKGHRDGLNLKAFANM